MATVVFYQNEIKRQSNRGRCKTPFISSTQRRPKKDFKTVTTPFQKAHSHEIFNEFARRDHPRRV